MIRSSCLVPVLAIALLSACGNSDKADNRAAAPAGPGSGGAAPPSQKNSGGAAPAGPAAGVSTLPNGPWTDLARRLVGARDLESAVAVTREVLARGGVATFDGSRVLVAANGPAASFRATPLETIHLAMEARHRATVGRLTAADFAQMLESFGWPFPGGEADGGRADTYPGGQVSDPEALRQAEQKERAEQRARERAAGERADQAAESGRQAGQARIDAAQQKVAAATEAWQRARQAHGKAPAGEKAAAAARVEAALAARMAAIKEVGAVRQAEREAEQERRTRTVADRDSEYDRERLQGRIGPDYRAGDRLLEMLADWVRGAAADPGNPRSFTPLFLAEMARLQDPPVDLLGSRFVRPGRGNGPPVDLRAGPRSGQLRLTLLEVELIAAAFDRRPGTSTARLRDRPPAGRDDVVRASLTSWQDPCAIVKEGWQTLGGLAGQTPGDAGGALGGYATGEVAGAALEHAIGRASDGATAAAFGQAMAALGMAAKIARLVALYADGEITVSVGPKAIHKPLGSNELVSFTATAGVSDEDWAEYERLAGGATGRDIDRSARDCLDSLGMPKLANMSDLAKEAEDWLVEWDLVEGAPPHAYYSLAPNDFYIIGRRAMKLRRSGTHSASAIFIVDILPEEKHSGRTVRAYVSARASLDAAGAPSLSTFLNPVLKGVLGLADSLVELGAGWFQFMNMPKAYGTIEVEYHCPRPTIIHQSEKPIGDGGGDGPNDCQIPAGSE